MFLIAICLLLNLSLDAFEVVQDFNRILIKHDQPYQQLFDALKSKHPPLLSSKIPSWQNSAVKKPQDVKSWLQEILGLNQLNQLSHKSVIKAKAFEINQVRLGPSIKQTFLIDDPILGQYKVNILIPDSLHESSPIVIANHGHGGSADSFISHRIFDELKTLSPIIVVPEYRAMRRIQEKQISQKLFQYGVFMMGVRINECLKSLELVKKLFPGQRKIFTIGHSGGSNISLLSSWITNEFSACLIDYQSNFFTDWSNFCCEGIPKLKNSIKWLYDQEIIPTKLKFFSYDYIDQEKSVRKFLDSFSTDFKKKEIKVTESKIPQLLKKLTHKSLAQVLSNKQRKIDILVDPQILSAIHQELENNQWDIDKDLLIKKLLEFTSLSYDSEIVSRLYPLVKLASVKLEILSVLPSRSSSHQTESSFDPKNEFYKLAQNFSSGSERDLFYLKSVGFFCTKSNSALALEILRMWQPTTPIHDVQNVISLLESSPILLRELTTPSEFLRQIQIPNDLKVLLGTTWIEHILNQKHKHLLQKEIQRISKFLPDSPLLPSKLIQSTGSSIPIIPSPQKNTKRVSEHNLRLLIYVGKLMLKRGYSDRAAKLVRWISKDESKLKYIREFIQEDKNNEESEYIHRVMKPLVEEMIIILGKKPYYMESHIDSLLEFFEKTKDQERAYYWLSKFLNSLDDPNETLEGDKDKVLSLIQLGVNLNSLNIISLILKWIPSKSFKDQALNFAFKNCLELRNEVLCRDLAKKHSNSSMGNNFQNQIHTLEQDFHRTAMLVKNDFINYANHPTNQIFESPILLESLEGYNGRALKNELSKVIEICFLETLKSKHPTTFIKLLSLSKMARIVSNLELRSRINSAIEKKMSSGPKFNDDYIEQWIRELIESGENSKASKYIKYLQSEALQFSYRVKIGSKNQNLTSESLQIVLKESEKLEYEDQAKIIIELIKVSRSLPQIQQNCLRTIQLLRSKLDFYDWIIAIFESIEIMNHQKYFFDSGRLMNRLNQIVISTSYENELSIKHNFFHASISSQSRPECLLNLKKFLIKIFSKLNQKHAIRELSNLMCDLDEQPYPLTTSIIKELKLFALDRIKISGPQCAKQAISQNNKNINLFQKFLLVCQ